MKHYNLNILAANFCYIMLIEFLCTNIKTSQKMI